MARRAAPPANSWAAPPAQSSPNGNGTGGFAHDRPTPDHGATADFTAQAGPPPAPSAARPYVSGGGAPYVPPGLNPPPIPLESPDGVPSPENGWRTSADVGWQAAAAAAEPQAAGTTRSGLPKRIPSAQLVPGGVEARTATARTKRSPDDVRGLLSAYHRGVQRGRSSGEGSSLEPRPDSEESSPS